MLLMNCLWIELSCLDVHVEKDKCLNSVEICVFCLAVLIDLVGFHLPC